MMKMEIDRINQFEEDITSSVNIKELMMHIFYQLDRFLVFLSKNKEEIIKSYVEQIEKDFDEIINNQEKEINFFKDYEKEIKFHLLHNYPNLLSKMRTMVEISFNLAQYEFDTDKGEVQLKAFDRFRGGKIPQYTYLLSLTRILPKEESIELYKESQEMEVKFHQDNPPTMESVDQMLSLYKKFFPKTHIFSLFKIQDGKVGCKLTRCMIYEVFKDYDSSYDQDIAFLTSCYNDYTHARSVNKHFVLTREMTIIEGDSICDFCWHDTQLVDVVEHPTKKIWDSID